MLWQHVPDPATVVHLITTGCRSTSRPRHVHVRHVGVSRSVEEPAAADRRLVAAVLSDLVPHGPIRVAESVARTLRLLLHRRLRLRRGSRRRRVRRRPTPSTARSWSAAGSRSKTAPAPTTRSDIHQGTRVRLRDDERRVIARATARRRAAPAAEASSAASSGSRCATWRRARPTRSSSPIVPTDARARAPRLARHDWRGDVDAVVTGQAYRGQLLDGTRARRRRRRCDRAERVDRRAPRSRRWCVARARRDRAPARPAVSTTSVTPGAGSGVGSPCESGTTRRFTPRGHVGASPRTTRSSTTYASYGPMNESWSAISVLGVFRRGERLGRVEEVGARLGPDLGDRVVDVVVARCRPGSRCSRPS